MDIKGPTAAMVAVSLLAFAAGCSRDLASVVMPGADIQTKREFYVQRSPNDDSNIAGFIAAELQQRGYRVTSAIGEPHAAVEVLVVYEDRWTWDVAPYLLTLRIDFRDPATNVLLATGKSYRTSFVRKSPQKVVREVLGSIFQEAGAASGAAR